MTTQTDSSPTPGPNQGKAYAPIFLTKAPPMTDPDARAVSFYGQGKDATGQPSPQWTYEIHLTAGTTNGVGAVAQIIPTSAGSPMPTSPNFFGSAKDVVYKQALMALKRANKGLKVVAHG
jgi:hypothetical protein